MNTMFKDIPKDGRLSSIQSMAETQETITYTRKLSAKELDEYRENMGEEMIKESQLSNELAELKKSYKEKIDPINRTIKDLLSTIKNKSIEVQENCYLIPDYDTNMMEYYNSDGEMINSRRLRPEERQSTMIKLFNQ